MAKEIKLILSFFFILSSFFSMYTKAATCPPVESIQRVNGEYLWTTTEPGWSGYFLSPKTGKGRSYKIDKFINASWVKSHDTVDSTGFIQCDYAGDFFEIVKEKNPNYKSNQVQDAENAQNIEPEYREVAANEVIRFVQSGAYGAYMPQNAKDTQAWSCIAIIKFPSEACSCFGDVNKCNFKFG